MYGEREIRVDVAEQKRNQGERGRGLVTDRQRQTDRCTVCFQVVGVEVVGQDTKTLVIKNETEIMTGTVIEMRDTGTLDQESQGDTEVVKV